MNTQEEKDQKLMAAAQAGDTEACKRLLKQGADIHAENEAALCWAAHNGHNETCKMLLDHGANTPTERTLPLRWAAEQKQTETCKLLLRHYKSLPEILKDPSFPELAKTLTKQEQNRRVAKQMRKTQTPLEI